MCERGKRGRFLKVLSLNVRHGGGDRWERIARFLEAQDPDVIVLLEWRVGSPERERWADSLGIFRASANDGKTPNGVFVAAKKPFKAGSRTPGQESPGALLLVEFNSWSMLACYVPGAERTDKAQVEAKARYFAVCREVASDSNTRPLLIIGDLNTGNQTADRTPQGDRYACAEHFDDLSRKHGLVDLWRWKYGQDKQEWTWFSQPRQNPFRLDHAFGNAPFIERFAPTCWYDHGPREAKFTDHSAVMVSLSETAKNVPNL